MHSMNGPILAELHRIRTLEAAAGNNSSSAASRMEERQVALYEQPFDPTIGAQQLAHAKQRIRDLRADVATLQASHTLLKDAMGRRQDIIDYIRQVLLQDSIFSHNQELHPDYRQTFLSILDGQQVHGMTAALERQMLGDQLLRLNEKVRMMDSRDSAKTLTIRSKDQQCNSLLMERDELSAHLNRSKAQQTNLYTALMDARQELQVEKEAAAQSRREAQTIGRSLDAAMAEIADKDSRIRVLTSELRMLQEKVSMLSSQSEADRAASKEALKELQTVCVNVGRTSDQLAIQQSGSPNWQPLRQQLLEQLRLLQGLLHEGKGSAGATASGDMLKPVIRALVAETEQRAALDTQLAEEKLQRANEASQVSLSVSSERDFWLRLQIKTSSANKSMEGTPADALAQLQETATAVDMSATSPPLIETMSEVKRTIQNICQFSRRIITDLLNKPAPPAVVEVVAPPPPLADCPISKDLLKYLDRIHSTLSKAIDKRPAAVFQDLLEEMDDWRSVPKPAEGVPNICLERAMDNVRALLQCMVTEQKEVEKNNAARAQLDGKCTELAAQLSRLAEERAAASKVPVAASSHATVQCDLQAPAVCEHLKALSGLESLLLPLEQEQSLRTNGEDGKSYERRPRIALCLSDVLEHFRRQDRSDGVFSLLERLVACFSTENDEVEFLGNVLQTVGSSAAKTQDAVRSRQAYFDMLRLAKKLPSFEDCFIALSTGPKTVTVEKVIEAPRPTTHTIATQTPKIAPEVPSVPSAVTVVKPPVKTKESGIQTTLKPPVKAAATQTPSVAVRTQSDACCATDPFLLNQYLGLQEGDGGGDRNNKRAPPRRSSIVQVFGSNHELSMVSSTREAGAAVTLLRRSSSIPSKMQSHADFVLSGGTVAPSLSSSSSGHPLGGVGSTRRPSSALSHLHHTAPPRDWDMVYQEVEQVHSEEEDDGEEASAEGGNHGMIAAVVPTSETRPPVVAARQASTAKILKLAFGTAEDGDSLPLSQHQKTSEQSNRAMSDFYNKLRAGSAGGKRMPSAGDKRPSSAMERLGNGNLRQRSVEVAQLHQQILTLRDQPSMTPVAIRQQQILSVVEGDQTTQHRLSKDAATSAVETTTIPDGTTAVRRPSVRQLIRDVCGSRGVLSTNISKVRPEQQQQGLL